MEFLIPSPILIFPFMQKVTFAELGNIIHWEINISVH